MIGTTARDLVTGEHDWQPRGALSRGPRCPTTEYRVPGPRVEEEESAPRSDLVDAATRPSTASELRIRFLAPALPSPGVAAVEEDVTRRNPRT